MEIEEIQKAIEYLKKDNAQNFRKAKKEGVMINWDIEKVKNLVDVYLDNVLRILKRNNSLRDKQK